MFAELRLLGSNEDSIVLQTRRREQVKNVPNVIGNDHVPQVMVDKFNRLVRAHLGWEIRKAPTGIYNCVGHVWACRRTGVFDDLDALILKIREDDGYRLLDHTSEQPRTGDLVTYWEGVQPYKNFLHIGVVEMRMGVTAQSPRVPWVVSKLDATCGEVLHHFKDVPYEANFPAFAVEFWTDRNRVP